MIRPGFWSHAVLLLSVVAPISLAEGSYAYLMVSVMVVAVGGWALRGKEPMLLGDRPAHALIVLAFAYLLIEYLLFDRILVTALSHFLITVCLVRLLQKRTPREDAQVVVLCLMLLVVGAIVSGNVLFAIALIVVMTVGLSLLIRLHLDCERARTTPRTLHADAERQVSIAVSISDLNPWPRGRALYPVMAAAGLFGLAVGTIVFLACPRIESSFLRQFHPAQVGPILTGFSSAVDLRSGQTISPSERTVMRVVIEGAVPFSVEEHETGHYFRGQASDRYGRRVGGLAAGWGWQRPGGGSSRMQTLVFDNDFHQFTAAYTDIPANIIEYQFVLEPGGYSNLFSPYPILTVSSSENIEVRFNRVDQTLRAERRGRTLRYTVTTVLPSAAPLVKMRSDFDMPGDPPLVVPEVPLPRAAEILQSIDEQIKDVGPLDEPANREQFLSELEAYLSSPAFNYSLTTPSMPPGREPIGEFLLNTRQGHCEYFASAMAVVCQLKGISARLVTGYRGGDYNTVGGFLVVRQKHAHAWVEAFVPGKGWLVYDPTPSASRVPAPAGSWLVPARTFMDYLQFQWANLVVAYDAAARQELIDRFHAWLTRPAQDETTLLGAVVAFVRELFGWRLEMSAGDRLLYWVFALLVVTLVVLVGYMLITAGRRLAKYVSRCRATWVHRRGGRADAEFYYRFCRRLEALGLRRLAGQTPAEFAEQLTARHVVFAPAPELVRIYYGVVFGNQRLSSSQQSWIQEFLRALNRFDPAEKAKNSEL